MNDQFSRKYFVFHLIIFATCTEMQLCVFLMTNSQSAMFFYHLLKGSIMYILCTKRSATIRVQIERFLVSKNGQNALQDLIFLEIMLLNYI